MMDYADLHNAIAAVCPVQTIDFQGQKVVQINFAPDATDKQKAAAQKIADNFDWSAKSEKDAIKDTLEALKKKPTMDWTQDDLKLAMSTLLRRT